MFRRKRLHALGKKVLKSAKQSQSEAKIDQHENWTTLTAIFSRFLVKFLDEKQLRTLVQSLENKGGIHTECVLIPDDESLARLTGLTQTNVLFCKVLRWPDLKSCSSLKTLVHCRNHEDSMLCGNPFHYSKIVISEKRPCQEEISVAQATIPDNDGNGEQYNLADETNSNCSEIQTPGYPSTNPDRRRSQTWPSQSYDSWCSIAYWENKRRIGRVFDVYSEYVNVFYELPQGDGLCIGLFEQVDQTDYVIKVRKHIGYGFQLTLEADGIWIYNRSDYCIFISSPVIQTKFSSEPNMEIVQPDVNRVPSGHCLQVVDFRKPFDLERRRRGFQMSKGPCDLYCIRVSFAKGWGGKYTRQYITSCPCWTEIYLKESCLAALKMV